MTNEKWMVHRKYSSNMIKGFEAQEKVVGGFFGRSLINEPGAPIPKFNLNYELQSVHSSAQLCILVHS